MSDFLQVKNKTIQLIFCFLCITIVSFLTYFNGYSKPASLFWDENYHIAAAEKYLNHMMFMESHAPFGKMLVAAGEWLLHPNDKIDKSSFLSTDYIKKLPSDYSFVGVRFFPVFLGMLAALLFFDILRRLSKKPFLALLLSVLYLFENGLIVHSRGAMLESPLIFFMLAAIDYFILLMYQKNITVRQWLLFGVLIGFSISIQWMGATLLLLFPFLIVHNQRNTVLFWDKVINFMFNGLIVMGGVLFIALGIFYLHFALGSRVVADKYYETSDTYKQILRDKQTSNVINFPVMFTDYLRYIQIYNAGIPRSDICKYPNENGTSPWGWPIGNKAINYRWETDGKGVRYLYLIGNPVVWLIGLLGILVAGAYVVGRHIYRLPSQDYHLDRIIKAFFAIYFIYMAMMVYLESKRAFYLYHYLPALVISLIIATALFFEREKKLDKKSIKLLYVLLTILCLLVIISYWFFAPFSYYLPLTTPQFQLRNWFPWWHLVPINN